MPLSSDITARNSLLKMCEWPKISTGTSIIYRNWYLQSPPDRILPIEYFPKESHSKQNLPYPQLLMYFGEEMLIRLQNHDCFDLSRLLIE